MVPHHHHGEMSDTDHLTEHESADDLMDYLELIFHVDMGEGHLEHFQGGESLDYDQLQSIDIKPIIGIVSTVTTLSENTDYQKTELQPYFGRAHIPPDLLSSSLRGPPFIS